MKLKVEYMPIDQITPYENNAKIHTEEQIEQIKASITEFGMNDPIAIWGKDNTIIEGHGRLIACQQLGMEEVPVIRLDSLTDEQRRAYTLVHNQTTMSTGFDVDILNTELDNIELDMSVFGFDDYEFNLDDDVKIEEDDIPDPSKDPKAKKGDIYQLGNHRLMCGDSTNINDVDVLLNNVNIKMIYTDMPYGMGLDTDYSGMKNRLGLSLNKNLKNGKKYSQGLVDEFNPDMLKIIFTIKSDEVFLWGADYFAELLPHRNDGSWIVWDKRSNNTDDIEEDYSSDKMFGSCFELCWSKVKHKRDIARVKWAGVFGTEQEFDHKRHHPTQKPIKLSEWFITRYTQKNDVILDLFGGSGSTLISCEQLDRKCYMMELDPHYVDVIIQRWENLTGKKAIRLGGVE